MNHSISHIKSIPNSSYSIHAYRIFYLISIPCHFHNQPFHVHFIPRIIQVHHSHLIHPLTHAYSFTSCHYIITQSNTCQTSKNRENIKPGHTLAYLFAQAEGSRSSERESRSASSLRLGESSKRGTGSIHTSSLRRALFA